MNYLIGTDEAGYGPNLGPLVICGTKWQAENDDLHLELEESVSRTPGDNDRLVVCDSKQVFRPGKSMAELETTVFAMLSITKGRYPRELLELNEILDIQLGGDLPDPPTRIGLNLKLPLVADETIIRRRANLLSKTCLKKKVELSDILCRAIYPSRFNQWIESFGNKSDVLSRSTFQIVDELTGKSTGNFIIRCDKHGGRNRYAALINQYLTDSLVSIEVESRPTSQYRWSNVNSKFCMWFCSGGEVFLPTALASMTAKYVREISMKIWNEFWKEQIPDIRPTQGYPADARRFKREIAAKQKQLAIPDESIWRNR